jgi:hypothetical protein
MKKYLIVFLIFTIASVLASWINNLVLYPEQPFLLWVHILIAPFVGIFCVAIFIFE